MRIAITAACHGISSTLPEDAPLWPVHRRDGQRLIHVEAAVLDRLRAMRKPGESFDFEFAAGPPLLHGERTRR